jgi:hypothetical protein
MKKALILSILFIHLSSFGWADDNSTLAQVSDIELDYQIPKDAKEIDFHLSTKFGDHLLVPVKFTVKEKNYEGWLQWDTGIRPNNCDIQITGDFFDQLGFKPKSKRIAHSGLAVTFDGSPTSGEIKFNYVANDKESDVGPVDIQVQMGNFTAQNIRVYTDPIIDRASSEPFNRSDPFFQGNSKEKVVGNVTFPFMSNYLISIDYKNKKIYLRPLEAEQRRFFAGKPLAVIDCVITDGIFCPVRVNDRPLGYGIFDTGNPYDIYDLSILNSVTCPLTHINLDEFDVVKNEPNYKNTFYKQIGFYSKTKLNLVSMIGNDTFQDRFVTIDPKMQKIYVEK